MVEIQGGSNYFEALLTGLATQTLQLSDALIHNRSQGVLGHDDTSAELRIGFPKLSNFVRSYHALLPAAVIDVLQLCWAQHFRS